MAVANDGASESSYPDDFESSWANSESAYNFDAASASFKSRDDYGGSLRQRNATVKQPRTKDEEMEDLLLQEARVQHQKIRAQTLSRRPTDKYDPLKKEATPIKEEDIEEEFDDGMSGSQSKTTGGGAFGIEEAKNYDSALSQSKSRDLSKSRELSQSRDHPRSPTKTETSKMSDSLAGGVQGSLNVFK